MHAATTSYQHPSLRSHRALQALTEFLFTSLACALLAWLAQPLALPELAGGLGRRYDISMAPESWLELWKITTDVFSRLGEESRAVLLLRTASSWLPALGLFGLGMLYIARLARPWTNGLLLLFIGVAALAWRPFDWPQAAGICCIFVGLCLMLLASHRKSDIQTSFYRNGLEPASMWGSLVWPGWVLLTGIGWLWIADFSARGPVAATRPGAKYLGLHQADAIFLAYAIVLLTVANSAFIVRLFARIASGLPAIWQRPRGALVLLTLGVAIAFGLGWLGHRQVPPLPLLHLAGAGMPHISGEILRLIAAIALAWAAYRYGEWHSSSKTMWRGLVATAVVGVLCLWGLILSGDMGPVLILSLTLTLFLAVPAVKMVARQQTTQRAQRTQIVVAAVLGLAVLVSGGVWLWRTALTDLAPRFSQTAALREAAREDPFSANSPNLAQAHWLMDAARKVGGFGLGRVPYCGAKPHIEASPCTLGSGAPIQLPSDFAFAGLASTWGMTWAVTCIALLFAWLRALTLSALPARLNGGTNVPGTHDQDAPLDWLRAWLVAVPCLMAQAQILVSVGGTMAWTPLTGVTLPLLGYGSVALCMTALWVGLAVRPLSGRSAV